MSSEARTIPGSADDCAVKTDVANGSEVEEDEAAADEVTASALDEFHNGGKEGAVPPVAKTSL